MNITNTIRPFPARSLVALLAISTIAIVAIAGAVNRSTPDEVVATASGTSAPVIPAPQPQRPMTTYVIVPSEEARDAFLAAEALAQLQREAASSPGLERDLHFFVVTNAAEEQRIWDSLGGVDEFVQIVDLVRPLPADPPVKCPAFWRHWGTGRPADLRLLECERPADRGTHEELLRELVSDAG